MANVSLDDVEISSYNATEAELEHAVSEDWRNVMPVKEETTTTETPKPATEQKTEPEIKTETKPTDKQETQQPQQKQRPEGWVPRKHLESSLKTEKSARERAVADNVRLTQEIANRDAELSRLRNGSQPQTQPQQPQQPVKAEEGFKPSKPEPQLADFKQYEDYDKAWRQWQVQRSDEYADWKASQQGKKLPEQIKQHTAAEQEAAERAEQDAKANDLRIKIESARVSDPDFQRVLDTHIAPPSAQKQLVGAMWGALMEVSNPAEVMKWIADNQDDWSEAVGRADGSASYNISASKLQHCIYQLSEHLEEQAEPKQTTQPNSNGDGSQGQPPAAATPTPHQQPQQPQRTTPVPLPASSAPAPSASSATRGGARTTSRNLYDETAWKGDGGDDAWIAERNRQRTSNRLPRGRSRF